MRNMTYYPGLLNLLDENSKISSQIFFPLISGIGLGMLFHAPYQVFAKALKPHELATGTSAFFLVRFTGATVGLVRIVLHTPAIDWLLYFRLWLAPSFTDRHLTTCLLTSRPISSDHPSIMRLFAPLSRHHCRWKCWKSFLQQSRWMISFYLLLYTYTRGFRRFG